MSDRDNLIRNLLYDTVEEMGENLKISIIACDSVIKNLEKTIERSSGLRIETLLLRGLLKDYKQQGRLHRKMLNKIEEYLEIRVSHAKRF